jgi:hypothetical protein
VRQAGGGKAWVGKFEIGMDVGSKREADRHGGRNFVIGR